MLKQFEEKTGMNLRSFQWIGNFSKADRQHFAEFEGWEGEIYVRNLGILTLVEYYQKLLKDGVCICVDGVIIAKTGYSDHYNSLFKECTKREKRQENRNNEKYPMLNKDDLAIFESAVVLYQSGILNLEQLTTRVKRYILPQEQEKVLAALTY